MATIQTTAKTVTTQQAADFVSALCDEFSFTGTQAEKNAFAQSKFDEFAWTWGRNIVIAYRKRQQPPVDTNTGL